VFAKHLEKTKGSITPQDLPRGALALSYVAVSVPILIQARSNFSRFLWHSDAGLKDGPSLIKTGV
jgi:hypothetical protein